MFEITLELAFSTLFATAITATVARRFIGRATIKAPPPESANSSATTMASPDVISSGTRPSRSETIKAPVQPTISRPRSPSVLFQESLHSPGGSDTSGNDLDLDVYGYYEKLLRDEYVSPPCQLHYPQYANET